MDTKVDYSDKTEGSRDLGCHGRTDLTNMFVILITTCGRKEDPQTLKSLVVTNTPSSHGCSDPVFFETYSSEFVPGVRLCRT